MFIIRYFLINLNLNLVLHFLGKRKMIERQKKKNNVERNNRRMKQENVVKQHNNKRLYLQL